jgi:hypothetical protein
VADLPALATVITDPVERRPILTAFAGKFNRRHDPNGPWPRAVPEEWVEHSPLARIDLVESD